ncbi:hypothetical protein GCM10009565_33730 [Amycolatopsis albidoflavus]
MLLTATESRSAARDRTAGRSTFPRPRSPSRASDAATHPAEHRSASVDTCGFALSGYTDQSHFNREFRALTGCAPTRFLFLTNQET